MEKALLVIDVQEKYYNTDRYDKSLIRYINERIAFAMEAGEKVVYIKNAGKYQGKEYISDFCSDLNVINDTILIKYKPDAFSNVGLLEYLKMNSIKHVTCIGIDGNFCVALTALGAKKHGIDAELLLSCVGISNQKRFEKTKEKLEQFGIKIA